MGSWSRSGVSRTGTHERLNQPLDPGPPACDNVAGTRRGARMVGALPPQPFSRGCGGATVWKWPTTLMAFVLGGALLAAIGLLVWLFTRAAGTAAPKEEGKAERWELFFKGLGS